MKNQKGFTNIEMMIVVAIIGIIIAVIVPCFNFSDGTRTGELVKFSNSGILNKSYEGQLKVSEGSTDGNGLWEFSVVDSSLVDKCNNSLGKKVKIKYQQGIVNPFKQNSSYTAISIDNF
jgi:prepilin-type N-terminal cleavage/methylation domain-containing protein